MPVFVWDKGPPPEVKPNTLYVIKPSKTGTAEPAKVEGQGALDGFHLPR